MIREWQEKQKDGQISDVIKSTTSPAPSPYDPEPGSAMLFYPDDDGDSSDIDEVDDIAAEVTAIITITTTTTIINTNMGAASSHYS
jgi:glycerate kinase